MSYLRSFSEEETRMIGERIGKCLAGGDILALVGNLGAGKTCLTQGIARGLGLHEEEVVSPTYRLIHEIRGPVLLYHVDLYRISNSDDLEDSGFYDAFDKRAVTVIEWADRFPNLIPKPHIMIKLERVDDNVRELTFIPHGEPCSEIIERLLNKITENSRQ